MDKRNMKIIYSDYQGVEKKAIELVNKEVGSIILRDKGVYTIFVLPLEKDGAEINQNVIVIGKWENNETVRRYVKEDEIPENGYLVKVFDNPENPDLKITILTGLTSQNVYYAAVDYVDNYLPFAAKNISNRIQSEYNTFDDKIPDYQNASAPKSKKRSIFTWGQPINDYREYIDNAARCKINQIIIWNDFLPINAKDVVDYAHEYEIELIWGFQWGWGTDCSKVDLTRLDDIKENVVKNFKENYMSSGDGIYFQSFTEIHREEIGGILIADAVVRLVNETAKEIYKLKPDIHIQFGLHAMSVKDRLEFIEKVDKRIEIVWEDCGSFPYNYIPKVQTEEEYKNTLDFTDKIIALRDNGKTGLVYKGLMTLDWNHFEHQSGPYILGVNSEKTKKEDLDFLTPMWRYFTSDWITYGKYAYDFTKNIHESGYDNINLNVAAQLAGGIWFPFALLTEILWNTDESYEEILSKVLKRKNIIMP